MVLSLTFDGYYFRRNPIGQSYRTVSLDYHPGNARGVGQGVTMPSPADDPQSLDINLNANGHSGTSDTLVSIGGNLPYSYLVPTGKLLDVFLALSASGRNLKGAARAKARKKFNAWLYNHTRPRFVYLVKEGVFHIAYAGQPGGAGSQHHWHIFCNEAYKAQVEFIVGITSTPPPGPGNAQGGPGGNYTRVSARKMSL